VSGGPSSTRSLEQFQPRCISITCEESFRGSFETVLILDCTLTLPLLGPGQIPPELGELSVLQSLDISGNRLEGKPSLPLSPLLLWWPVTLILDILGKLHPDLEICLNLPRPLPLVSPNLTSGIACVPRSFPLCSLFASFCLIGVSRPGT